MILFKKAGAVLEGGAAVFILPFIKNPGIKSVYQVTGRGIDLHTVKIRLSVPGRPL